MSDVFFTGVEGQDVPAAGEQGSGQEVQHEEGDYEEDLFGLAELGVDDNPAAGDGETADTGDDPVEIAFAKRLAAEREKIRQEFEAEYRTQGQQGLPDTQRQQSYPQSYQHYPQQGQQQYQQQPFRQQGPPQLQPQQLDDLADQLGVTTEAAYAMYHQQWLIEEQNRAIQEQRNETLRLADERARIAARTQIESQRKKNPNLPEFDDNKLIKLRSDYFQRTGLSLPWDDVYQLHVANEAMSGNLSRSAEQAAIESITSRNKTNVQAGTGRTGKQPGIEDLSSEQFEDLIEQAKAGKFKKS